MKKTLLFPLLVFISIQGFAHADDLSSRLSILEIQMSEISTKTVHGNYGGKTASASPPISGENWFFAGQMLYWQVNEGGTDYAQSFEGNPGISSVDDVHNHRLKFGWDFGFRVNACKTFEHDKWDLSLNFTWFRTKKSATALLHSDQFLIPVNSITQLKSTEVKTHGNIHFYNLDLNLGRRYFLSPKFALHPTLGIKSAWISQHFRTHSAVFYPFSEQLYTKQKNGFFGIGPEIGLRGKWFLPHGFHLTAAGAGSLLWGAFTIAHHETTSVSATPGANLHFDIHDAVPMAQLQMGFGYETNIYHNKYRLEFGIAYENQYWWDQNQLPRFVFFAPQRFERYSEDLSLQGVTVEVKFDF